MNNSRRRFVQGIAAGGVMAAWGERHGLVYAAPGDREPQQELRGTQFDLSIGETQVNYTGSPKTGLTINGSLPAPLLRWREGDTVTVRVSNRLRDRHASIHWHGIILPAAMDGVPGLSFDGILPGETFVYRFQVKQAGTYWYHSHSAFTEQQGLYGPIVIEPRDASPVVADREYVVMLSEWTDEDPERLFAKLKKRSDYYNFTQRTVGDFFHDVRTKGFTSALDERRMWNQMRMRATDLADVSGATYTYLMNGTAPAGNWTGIFKTRERVRLRFVNGSAMTYFDVRIPGLKMTVVAADGQYVHPVTVDELRIAVAETYDVIVEPSGQDAYTIFAQSVDRTGYAAGTLALRPGLRAAVPAMDPRQLLTMADMGMGGMSHDMSGMQHDMGAMPQSPDAPARSNGDPHAGHVIPAEPQAGAGNSSGSDPHAGHDMSAMAHDMGGMQHDMSSMQRHPLSEIGNPLVDNQAMSPTARLDDPGVGLRGLDRRVLTYADLRSAFEDPDGRDPGRTIELHLTGHMERFSWSFDGIKFSDAEPMRLNYGERLRIVLVNDTMMSHPIHLHGMWSDVEDEQGAFMVRKHTVDIPPGTRRTYRVRADALGRWAYHCHMLYHMEAGMFREVRVEG